MNKKKITKLQKAVFSSVMDLCEKDPEFLAEKIGAVIDEHFSEPVKQSGPKPYLAPTGETEKIGSFIRTKGQSEKADAIRGK